MLILILALHAAAIATPPLDLQRHPKRSVTRSVRRSRHRVRTVALRPVLPACRAGSVLSRCATPDHNAKYRLGDTPDESVDAKARALQGPFRNCGVTGMPVCPSNGQKIIDTNPR